MPQACLVLSVVILTSALAGCGEQRTRPPNQRVPVAPLGYALKRFPRAGVSFSQPINWTLRRGPAPLVASVSSSQAIVSIWRYPRSEPLPSGQAALKQARIALIGAARHRDPTLRVTASGIGRVAGHDALVLIGRERVGAERRSVYSVHIFAYGAEVVFDALAPSARFRAIGISVFGPVLTSLHLSPPRGRPRSPLSGVPGFSGLTGPASLEGRTGPAGPTAAAGSRIGAP